MKVLFIFSVIATLVAVNLGRTKEEKELEIITWGKECQDNPEFHIDPDTLKKYIDEDDLDLEHLDKHFRCMLTKMGVMNEYGAVNPEGLRRRMSEEFDDGTVLNKLVEECAQEKESPEETALYIRKCIQKFRDDI